MEEVGHVAERLGGQLPDHVLAHVEHLQVAQKVEHARDVPDAVLFQVQISQIGIGDACYVTYDVETKIHVLQVCLNTHERFCIHFSYLVPIEVQYLQTLQIFESALWNFSDDIVCKGQLLKALNGAENFVGERPNPVVIDLQSL